MADRTDVAVERVFELLDRWRHLPAYQLERRADIFFALFLPDVLEERLRLDRRPAIIPEFPIKTSDENNRSAKVDYLALLQSQDGKPPARAFLVELKTDMGSRRGGQDALLVEAKKRNLRDLIADVVDICGSTVERQKYAHLLKLLSDVDLIEYREDLFPGANHRSHRRALDEVKGELMSSDKAGWPFPEVVYVQPFSEETVIDFKDFAKAIERSGAFGQLFAKSLREWTAPAGSPDPKEMPPCPAPASQSPLT